MEIALDHTHSFLRWVALLFILLATITAFLRWKRKGGFGLQGKFLNLFTMISFHLQLLIGLVLYFISDKVNIDKVSFGSETAKLYNFYTVEHLSTMLLAIILVTIGHSKAKKASSDQAKNRRTFIFFGIALILVFAAIPWPFRGLGAGWF